MKKLFDSTTKVIVVVLLLNAILWVWCSYAMAYMGRVAIAETLSTAAIKTILGTVITYSVKSAVENVNKHGILPRSREDKKNKIDY